MAQGKNLLGVSAATAPAIEAHLRELLDALCVHFETHRFLLGDFMSLADCGLMGPFYGHLFRDAVPERILLETAFRVCCWIERMNRPPLPALHAQRGASILRLESEREARARIAHRWAAASGR